MFKRIYFFFISYIVANTYSQTLLYFWWYKQGVSYLGMLFCFLITCLVALIVYFAIEGRSISSKGSLFLGVLANALAILIVSRMTHPWQAYVVAGLFAVNAVFFWTIYNALYFEYSNRQENGFKSGLYYLIWPLVGVIFSPLAGFVAERFGYGLLFLSSLVIYIIPLVFIFYLPVIDFKFETRKSTRLLENKTLVFLQGYNSIINMSLFPIFTLFFIHTAFGLGNFFGYMALLSTLVAFINSTISDKLKGRVFFFYFFTILSSLANIPMAFAKSVISWQIFSGINNMTSKLESPFGFALILDHAKGSMAQTMLGREVYLQMGRAAMLLVAITVLWLTGSYWTALVICSFSAMFYPVAAYYQKVYLK